MGDSTSAAAAACIWSCLVRNDLRSSSKSMCCFQPLIAVRLLASIRCLQEFGDNLVEPLLPRVGLIGGHK